jgi:hypothetical protein
MDFREYLGAQPGMQRGAALNRAAYKRWKLGIGAVIPCSHPAAASEQQVKEKV